MKFKTFLICSLVFYSLAFTSNAQTSLFDDVKAERARYCPRINKAEAAEILNTVAWNNRADGWGLSGKTIGNACPFATGTIACDILHHQPSNKVFDALGSSPDNENPLAPADVIWIDHGRQTQSNRPWVAPVQPSGPERIQRDCNEPQPPRPNPAPQPPGPNPAPQPPGPGPGPDGPGLLPQPLPGTFIPLVIGAVPNNAKPGDKIEIIGTYLGSRIILESADGRQKVELNASLNQQKTRASIDLPSDLKPGKYNVSVISGNLSDSKPGILTITEAPPGLFSGFGPIQDIGDLVETIFKWGLWLVGLAVFVNFLWAGLLWFTAAGRPGPIGEAKGKMTNGLIGAVILLAAYLILNTINPDLLKQTFTLPGF